MLRGFPAELCDGGRRGVGLQERVVDEAGNVHGETVPEAWRRFNTIVTFFSGKIGYTASNKGELSDAPVT